MTYFVTGTDTGVGKTYFCARLTRALRKSGFDTVALKPFCCGSREDSITLRAAADDELPIDTVNPVWLKTAASPYTASLAENAGVPVDMALQSMRSQLTRRRSVLIEGVGGWLVPIRQDYLVADFAAALELPVLIVVLNRLGCLNHTLLTIESIRARGLKCAGLVLNTIQEDDSTSSNRRILEDICDVPVLFELSPGQKEIEIGVA